MAVGRFGAMVGEILTCSGHFYAPTNCEKLSDPQDQGTRPASDVSGAVVVDG